MKRVASVMFSLFIVLLVLGSGVAWAQGGDDPILSEEPGVDDVIVAPLAVNALVTPAFAGSPAYDSGWVAIQQAQATILRHALGGNLDDYVVIMDYKDEGGSGVNQRYYGGVDFGAKTLGGGKNHYRVGAYWRSLTTDSITIYRRPEDTYADWVRIRIWLDPHPDYDSGWVSLSPGGAATTLHHNLGGNANDYVVDMQYRSSGSGVNQRYFGGNDFGAKAFNGSRNNHRVGLYWRTLTNTSITLFRRAEDNYAQQVRVRIWRRYRPTYDSGWVTLSQNQAKSMIHGIGGDPDNYIVDMQFRSGGNTNQRYYGGMDFGASPPSGMHENDRVGAYWRSLSQNRITVYRRPEDIYASQVRIRIWHYWRPITPDFDSRWQIAPKSSAISFNHNLGGSPNDYLVDMQYKASDSNGINLRYAGGSDFGGKPAPGHATNHRVGLYWRSLTNSSITFYRRAEDTYAQRVRIRIWRMPKPDYDSGWANINKGEAKTFSHNLQGSVYDYLVDMQSWANTQGVNQRYFGGIDFGAYAPSGMNEDDRVGTYWRTLTNNDITVYRRPDDIYGSKVRVRIWRIARPDYDSGWVSINQNQAITRLHQLYGSPDNYFLQMWQYDATFSYLNQRHYGGADFGTHAPTGYANNDRVGSYWRSLTTNAVTLYRRPEDGFADWVRVRIWDYNQRQYLPSFQRNAH